MFKMNIDSAFEDTSEYYFDDLETYKEGYNTRGYDILRPTWEQVFEWFRSKGFHSYIEYTSDNNLFKINIVGVLLHTNMSYFETYEKAREALINKLIEIYGNEKL